MAKPGRKKVRSAPPVETERHVKRVAGSGAAPFHVPENWRPTWRQGRERGLKERQLAGLTREEKLSVLREIVEGCGDTNVGAVLKAIEIDNKMQGHNAAEKIETHVTGDLLEVVRREAVVS